MRLDDDLLHRAKERAAQTGRTLTALIEDGLRTVLARSAEPGRGRRPRPRPQLPVSGRGGTLPGVDLDRAAELSDLMDGAR